MEHPTEDGITADDVEGEALEKMLQFVGLEYQLVVQGALRGPVPTDFLTAHLGLTDASGEMDEEAVRDWIREQAARVGGGYSKTVDSFLESIERVRDKSPVQSLDQETAVDVMVDASMLAKEVLGDG